MIGWALSDPWFRAKSGGTRGWFGIAIAAWLVFAALPRALAQEDAPAAVEPLQYQRVFLYENQAASLIPRDYRPVTAESLEARLEERQEQADRLSDQKPRLNRVRYRASFDAQARALRSEQTTLDFSYAGDAPQRLSLGPLNWSVTTPPPSPEAANGLPRLLTSESGEAVVTVADDSQLNVAWTRRGVSLPDGSTAIPLQLPTCARAQMVLDVPRGYAVEVDRGVLRALPNAPPEVGVTEGQALRRWYRLELGGLSSVRLTVLPERDEATSPPVIVRRQSMIYDVEPRLIRWTTQMTIETTPGQPLPGFALPSGRLTAATVDGQAVKWTGSESESARRIQLDLERPLRGTLQAEPVELTLSGVAKVQSATRTSLPWPRFTDRETIVVAPTVAAQIRCDDAVKLAGIALPAGWQMRPTIVTEDGSETTVVEGAFDETFTPPSVRLLLDEPIMTGRTALRLSVGDRQIDARWDAVLEAGRQPKPVRLQFERGWRIGNVTLTESGRLVDIGGNQRTVTIWPESADVDDAGTLRLRVEGQLPLRGSEASSSRVVPATWFARAPDCRTDALGVVTPPRRFRWAAGTSLRGQGLQVDDLDADAAELLGTVADGALLFGLPFQTTPFLELVRPLPTVDASVSVEVTWDGQEITERLTLVCNRPAATAAEVVLRCGRLRGRPPLNWSLTRSSAAGLRLPRRADKAAADEEDQETWVVTLPSSGRGQLRMTARRRYRCEGNQTIDLPAIVQVNSSEDGAAIAVNQSLTADVEAPLQLQSIRGSAERVPRSEGTDEVDRLRYEPTEPAAIVVGIAPRAAAAPIFWEQQVDVVASSRYGDTVLVRYRSDGRKPLRIEHGTDLRLREAMMNGQAMDVEALSKTSGEITLGAAGGPLEVALRFDRTIFDGGMLRLWKPPLLKTNGVVVKRNWRLWPAVDSLAPSAFFALSMPPRENEPQRLFPAVDASRSDLSMLAVEAASVPVRPSGGGQWLMALDLAWAIALGTSLLLFALGWAVARRSQVVVLAMVLVLGVIAVGFPATAKAIVGFAVTPLIAAALVELALRRRNEVFYPPRSTSDVSFGISKTSATTLLVWLAVATGSMLAFGQEASGPEAQTETSRRAATVFPILIPVTEDGELAGKRVYVPKPLYEQLYRPVEEGSRRRAVQLRRADYRVRLDEGATPSETARVEVRLELETDDVSQPVQLPFPAAAIRDIEIVSVSSTRSIRWLPSDNAISVSVLKEGVTTLRITLDADVKVDEYGVRQIEMAIPPIMFSALNFDADRELRLAECPTALGATTGSLSAGELSADLGPTDTLAVRWRVAADDPVEPPPLVRRYLVQSSQRRLVTECLMDLSDIVTDAEPTVTLEFDQATLPIVLSPAWQKAENETPGLAERMVLRCTDPSRPPLRLLWRTPLEQLTRTGAAADFLSYALPEVRVAGEVPLGPTYVAVNEAIGQTLRVDASSQASSMQIDRFLGGWNSNVDVVQQAYRAEKELPRLLLAPASPRPWRAEPSMRVRAESIAGATRMSELKVLFEAMIRAGDAASAPLRLTMPRDLRVHEILVADQPVRVVEEVRGRSKSLALPELSGSDSYRLQLRGSLDVARNGRFSPPAIRIEGIDCSAGGYALTRGQDTLVVEKEPTTLAVETFDLPNSERLAATTVPLWAWEVPGEQWNDANPFLPGSYEVRANPTITAVTQVTKLSLREGRWQLETTIQMQPERGRIDFVTVELPARWSEDVAVSNARSWLNRPAQDPQQRLIRILPADTTGGRHELKLRSRLVGGDLSQISVPKIRVLGRGDRRTIVSVPKAINDKPIVWDVTGQRRIEPPADLSALGVETVGDRLFEVAGAWSVTMASNERPQQPTARVQDIQVFSQPQRPALLVCRWDLFPADRTSVTVRLPESFEVLGQWAAGTAIPARRDGERLEIPLRYHHLAQPVVVVGRYTARQGQDLALPELVDVPTESTWLVRYRSLENDDRDEPPASWQTAEMEARRIALAGSVLGSLEDSRDALANRPADEVAIWLAPWTGRFERLAAMQPRFRVDGDAEDSGQGEKQPRPAQLQSRMRDYLSSVLGRTEAIATEGDPEPLEPIGWQVAGCYRLVGTDAVIPARLLVVSRIDRETWIMPAAVALLCVLVLLATYRFADRLRAWTSQPACWLFLLGIVGLLLAPLPVAVSLCFVAVLSPWLRRSTPRHP